jgi:translation initiation factor 1A
MVKNVTGGSKTKNQSRKQHQAKTYALDDLRSTEDQDYAVVTKVNGGSRFVVGFANRSERLGKLCGRLQRGTRVAVGSIVLCALRDFQDSKCDIVHVYNQDQVQMLADSGDLNLAVLGPGVDTSNDSNITFSNAQNEEDVDFANL